MLAAMGYHFRKLTEALGESSRSSSAFLDERVGYQSHDTPLWVMGLQQRLPFWPASRYDVLMGAAPHGSAGEVGDAVGSGRSCNSLRRAAFRYRTL